MDPLRLDPLCLSSFLSCKPFLSILSSTSLCFQHKSPMWYDDDAMQYTYTNDLLIFLLHIQLSKSSLTLYQKVYKVKVERRLFHFSPVVFVWPSPFFFYAIPPKLRTTNTKNYNQCQCRFQKSNSETRNWNNIHIVQQIQEDQRIYICSAF